MKSSIHNLKTEGYVALSYPKNLRASVEETVEAWKQFCALPAETKKNLPYSNAGAGVGYELKDGAGPKGDKKENLDVTLGGKEWLETNAKIIDNKVAFDFITKSTNLVSIMKPLIVGFAAEAERTFGIKDFKKEVEESENAFFVRFIHYFGDRKPGEETASAHTDQSGFTLHLYESHAGLQCFTKEKIWIDMPVSRGETVIIPCMQLQLRSGGDLVATCHRVVASEETARTGRFSAVCFVQLKNTPKYDKETHGRLQEKEPGFNYHLSHDEFKKLFKN